VVTVDVAPMDDSGRVIPGVVLLMLFGASVLLLLAMVMQWAGHQHFTFLH
jgi:hypothetical protein